MYKIISDVSNELSKKKLSNLSRTEYEHLSNGVVSTLVFIALKLFDQQHMCRYCMLNDSKYLWFFQTRERKTFIRANAVRFLICSRNNYTVQLEGVPRKSEPPALNKRARLYVSRPLEIGNPR